MSQRERLLGRRIPPTRVSIRADFSVESDIALGVVDTARQALLAAQARGDDPAPFQQRLDEAEAAAEAFYEVLTVSPIPANQYEALVDAHPPSEDLRKQGYQWDPVTFVPALLAACIGQDEDDPMTVEDWAKLASEPAAVASGEIAALFQVCIQVNDRSPDVRVGKG